MTIIPLYPPNLAYIVGLSQVLVVETARPPERQGQLQDNLALCEETMSQLGSGQPRSLGKGSPG